MSKTELVIWGAVGPNGQVIKSSIGTFRAVANRWAQRHRDFTVVKLGEIKVDNVVPLRSPETKRRAETSKVTRLPVGRPRRRYPIDTRVEKNDNQKKTEQQDKE